MNQCLCSFLSFLYLVEIWFALAHESIGHPTIIWLSIESFWLKVKVNLFP